ncbi:hypothetical protein M434DRAFT_393267 [Hypoxylon sp. CO27-5]|nr:hypothetical protein M434DRAFT_393267 [Hypoxylon sp. CO27-5]
MDIWCCLDSTPGISEGRLLLHYFYGVSISVTLYLFLLLVISFQYNYPLLSLLVTLLFSLKLINTAYQFPITSRRIHPSMMFSTQEKLLQ